MDGWVVVLVALFRTGGMIVAGSGHVGHGVVCLQSVVQVVRMSRHRAENQHGDQGQGVDEPEDQMQANLPIPALTATLWRPKDGMQG